MAPVDSVEHFRVKPRWLFVKLTDGDGLHGWGEATLEGHSRSVEGALDDMRSRIIGLEADDIERIWQKLYRQSFYRGGPVFMSAISGIDIALWDLKARRLGVPIHQLLGGRVRDRIKVYTWIGGDRPDDVEAAAKARIDQGYKAVKMNATSDIDWLDDPEALDSAVSRLCAVKSLGLAVGLDFHGRLHKPMAKQLAARLAPHGPLFIEEPLLSEHVDAITALAGQTSVPIALGERLYTRWDVKPFLEKGAVDILQPDLAHAGGISEVRRIAAMAEAYDVAIAPHCPLGPIALAASMQIAATTQNFVIQEMSRGIHYNVEAGGEELETYLQPASKDVFGVEDGYCKVLEGKGLGIEIDEEVMRRISQDTQPWALQGFTGADGALREW